MADHFPVTDADEAAEAVILAGLLDLTPDIPVIAEELAARGRLPALGPGRFWLVDPLDGTREFIGRNGEFTGNVALIGADRRQQRSRRAHVRTPVTNAQTVCSPLLDTK